MFGRIVPTGMLKLSKIALDISLAPHVLSLLRALETFQTRFHGRFLLNISIATARSTVVHIATNPLETNYPDSSELVDHANFIRTTGKRTMK
ncbi:hypothetical protein VTO42DRAFT_339 [Malbranchea cinnamomea]